MGSIMEVVDAAMIVICYDMLYYAMLCYAILYNTIAFIVCFTLTKSLTNDRKI